MKKRFCVLLFVITAMTVTGLSGCHNKNETTGEEDGTSDFLISDDIDFGYGDESESADGDRSITESSSESQPAEIDLTNIAAGDSIALGKYPQNTFGDKADIYWRVLDVTQGRALLISEKILFGHPYNDTQTDVTWAQSSLRSYLNNTFIKETFNSTEAALIVESQLINDDNNSDDTSGGDDTRDKVFCLSLREVNKYFPTDEERKCEVTLYAQSQVAAYNRIGSWWLRSPGYNQDYAAIVTTAGGIRVHSTFLGSEITGKPVTKDNIGVRPAMWINIDNVAENTNNDSSGQNEPDNYPSGSAGRRSISLNAYVVDDLSESSCFLVIGTKAMEREAAIEQAQEARIAGYPAHAIKWGRSYYVSLGGYENQDKADEVLWYAVDNGYSDARVEYTGPAVASSQISKID